jgi:hypothetical protein
MLRQVICASASVHSISKTKWPGFVKKPGHPH